jgi:hypothetical protein
MKILPVRAELFYEDGKDGQTDLRDEANSRFWHFAKAPTTIRHYWPQHTLNGFRQSTQGEPLP